MRPQTTKVGLITVMVAACVGSNYALIGIPNFKIMDLLVFVSGFTFGGLVGASIGILTWAVYGVLNPYGFVPQIWLSTMISEAIYGFVGGFLAEHVAVSGIHDKRVWLSLLFGAVGFLTTFLYDVITNIAFAWTFNVPVYVAIIAGAPFAIIHELTNMILFGVCAAPLISVLSNNGGVRL